MTSTRQMLMGAILSAFSTAFDFEIEPSCVPIPSEELNAEILPFLCKFEEDAEYDPGFDCTDITEECLAGLDPKQALMAKFTWASTKKYLTSQGTSNEGCDFPNMLTRDVAHPLCVFGLPVPEKTIGDYLDTAVKARELAEKILSRNPTPCAAALGQKIYDIYGAIYPQRVSKVATHGLRQNYDLKYALLAEDWNPETNDCTVDALSQMGYREETDEQTEQRLGVQDFEFSREILNAEECTLIRHYNGSSFAKPHPGGLLGCKIECMNEPTCNAFNMDLRFQITIKQAQCDLLNCPAGVAKESKFGFVGFTVIEVSELDAPQR